MRRKWIYTVLPLTLFAMIAMAYKQATPSAAPRSNADGPISESFTAPTGDSSIDPLAQAIEMDTAEIALARIASGKAQNAKVRSFAEIVIKDHSAALKRLQGVQGVTTTEVKLNLKHQATADRLSKLQGLEFDREYVRTVVAEHQDALKAALSGESQERIPTIREHLLEAQNVLKYLGTTPLKTHKSSNSIRLGLISDKPSPKGRG